MKRKLLKLGIWSAALLVVCGAFLFLPGGAKTTYGLPKGAVSFSEGEFDITDLVAGSSEYLAAENGMFALYLDSGANITVRDKSSGRSWSAVPAGAQSLDKKYSSSLNIEFYEKNAPTFFYSSDDSVNKNQFRVFATDTGVSVEYIFGELSEDFVFPEQISEKRMKKYLAKMSAEDMDYIGRRYTLYSIELTDGANRDYLLSQYPRLKEENLYVLTDASNNSMKKKIDEIFRNAGYTYEDRDSDNSGAESKTVNPKSFKAALDYELTDNGFRVRMAAENTAFYTDYPISTVELLPNFSCFSGEDSGYYMVPHGSGALFEAGGGVGKDTSLSLPVYGQNSAVTRKLDRTDSICTLPVFGQYKDGGGFLCIIDGGAEQAELQLRRSSPYTQGFASYEFIDNGIFQMKAKNDTTLFASKVSADIISEEYILLDGLEKETAYSEMASVYRGRLKADEIITDTADNSSVRLLTEFIGSIAYDSHFMGMIPDTREYALTSYSQMSDIAGELQETVGKDNLVCLISGWNKNGLNAQNPGTVKYSGRLGGRKAFEKAVSSMAENGIEYYVNLELVFANPDKLFAYNSFSKSARSLNNGVAELSVLDPVACTWSETARQLTIPSCYRRTAEFYAESFDGSHGIGVSQLSSMLCGDYSSSRLYMRADSRKAVDGALETLSGEHKVIGNAGNSYTLKYLSFIDLLSRGGESYDFSRRVPFVQLVVHGYIPYVSGDMNSENSRVDLLKHIEYGENLRYTVTANKFDKLHQTVYSELFNTLYSSVKDEIAENYKFISTALNGLMNKEMISHSVLSEGIVKVGYSDGTVIYINYTDSDFTVEGITVGALNYIRK